jgi:hypothetical protein
MSYTPLSREYLRSLKRKQDEESKEKKIVGFIQTIYESSVNFAKTNSDTIFKYNISSYFPIIAHPNPNIITHYNVIEYMDEILRRLRILFPDSRVEFKKISIVRGRDGKDYDLSIIDDTLKQFIDIRLATTTENIVIDYSDYSV